MEQDDKCSRRRLGGKAPFRVECCDCGAIHLTIGFATLRLDSVAFRELASAIAEAVRNLGEPPMIH